MPWFEVAMREVSLPVDQLRALPSRSRHILHVPFASARMRRARYRPPECGPDADGRHRHRKEEPPR